MDEPGLRERKAALTRKAIADSILSRLGTQTLADITVDEIAADVNISRVTFHNYFPTKEHALDHIFARMSFEISAHLAKHELRGIRAIVAMFELTGRRVAQSPLATLRMYGHLATRSQQLQMPVLTRADRLTIFEVDPGELEVSTGRVIMTLLEQARSEDGLVIDGSSYELAHYLGALLNGAATTGGSSPDTDYERLFRRHVRRALGLGFEGGHGLEAVAAPRTPARYQKPSSKGGAPRDDHRERNEAAGPSGAHGAPRSARRRAARR